MAASGESYRGIPGFGELWLVARRADRLEALAAELRKASPGLRVEALALDLVAPGALASLEERMRSARPGTASGQGPLRVLVNNAGFGTYGDFDDTPLELSLGQVDINCRAVTEACARLSPFLARGAVVINVASLAAFAPLGGFAVYAASKAYCLSLSVGLASEWKGRGVRVCALCPGPVASEFALVASAGARREVRHGWSADRTAALCLRDAGRGRRISMPRPLWRLRRAAGWLFGPELSADFAYRFMRRPSARATGSKDYSPLTDSAFL